MKILQVIAIVIVASAVSAYMPNTVGFEIGQTKAFNLLKKSGSSALYQIESPQIQDGRPMKLIHLTGSHYEVGFAYGDLLGKEIIETYNAFLDNSFSSPIVRDILELFLDWQYDNFIVNKIPNQFRQQMTGIQDAGVKVHKISKLRNLVERTLVFSSYPGDFSSDIMYALVDIFVQKWLKIQNPHLIDFVENNMFALVKDFKHFMNRKRIHCSFMAAWGSRTQGGKLYTMRNLDWQANSGVNKNKVIFVWNIHNTVPHTTVGFPGIIGALTGMSQAGLTVHQAGLDSMKQTELGFQWTLRLRYILMHAKNLAQAMQIWTTTENTFGMNHMVASAADVPTGQTPVFVVQTMRGYNAFFKDKDPREDNVTFIDPKTKKSFRAGFAMKDTVFRTNHAYDPKINKFRTQLPSENESTMHRYMIIKDSINVYQQGTIGELEALNITANVAHKGGNNFYKCPEPGKDNGTNIISVMFVPGEQRMYAAVEYGSGNNYRTACCGVYLNIDMAPWFAKKAESLTQEDLILE